MLRASDDDDDVDDDGDDDDDDDDECRGPDLAQNADTHTHILCEPAQWKCMSTGPHVTRVIRKATSWGKLKEKCHGPKGDTHTHTHAPLHSKKCFKG